MKEWFTIDELLQAKLPTLPGKKSALTMFASRHWQKNPDLFRQVKGKTKPVGQYHIDVLPPELKTIFIFSDPFSSYLFVNITMS